jgi:hypothetical protein
MPLAGRDPTNETPPAKNPGCSCQSVVGRLVEDDYKADDLAVTHAEVVRQNKIVGQIGPVERTVVGSAQYRIVVMIEHLANLNPHLVTDYLFGHPAADGVDSDEFAVVVVDVGILGECGEDAIAVAGVDRVDVVGDDPYQIGLFDALVSRFVVGRCCSR